IWGNQCQTVGIGGRFLAVGDELHSFNVTSAQNPIIGVPFFELDPFDVGENAFLAAHPTRGSGSVAFNSRATLYAGDAYLRFKFGYRILNSLEATLGYNGLYWNRMAQAGEQVDRTLNSTQFEGGGFTGAPRPEFGFRLRDYYVQGITIGLQGAY